ncbi:M48 family metallopeptidase [Crocinitomix catalasitica]|nr:M48 family metallopeptidase [Crocinitomix catalasitica]
MIPQDFLRLTIDKYKEDIKKNENKELDKDFFLSTRFFIDELLLSGRVLFNDPCTKYLNKVAKNLLRREKKLQEELRFYVLKTTVANAFSTDQGIIFITTGLIATLENEAQLAYILAHEISHYTEKHLQEGYIEEQRMESGRGEYKRQNYDERISQMSVYDKKNELEADIGGIDIYLDSEYAVDEIFSSFEVLLFSYLPFDDIQVDTTYLNTEALIVPGSYYPDTIKQISLEKDYDDEGSTHPNIEKRMDEAVDYIGEKKSKGDLKFKISEDDFFKVRDLCRFEHINLHLANCSYGRAIYSIYLLQKKYPDSEFLELAFVKCWYGLAKYKNANRYYDVIVKPKKIEGESYKLHFLLKQLKRSQLNVMALRYAIDFAKKYPKNKMGKVYLEDMQRELVAKSKFDFRNLKDKTFNQYQAELTEELKTFDVQDSIKKVDESDLSKYEKIKLKKKLRGMLDDSKDEEIALDDFHLFALYDVVKDDDLIDDLKDMKDKIEEEPVTELSYAERKRLRKRGYRLGLDKVVVVDPLFENFKTKGRQNLAKSESKKVGMANIYSKKYRRVDLEIELVDSKQLRANQVEKYNEIGILFEWVSEVLSHDEIKMISSSRDIMLGLNEKHGTSHYLFTGVQMFKDRNSFSTWHLYAIMAVYTSPIALIDLIIPHNYFTLTALSIDAETDQVEFAQSETVNLKGVDMILQAYVFDVLYQLGKEDKRAVK